MIMRYFMNTISHAKPPSRHYRKPPWRVALIANLKDEVAFDEEDHPPDAGAEFDARATVESIAAALEDDGHWVHICRGDQTLVETLPRLKPHICFNIAEGISGDSREAQAPAVCELLGIPYTASRILTHAISLDKTQTKRIWRSVGLLTADFQEFVRGDEPIDAGLHFPLLVKPAREGTGMGIDARAVVNNQRELRQRVEWVIETYRQPALAETYLPGREFTVGFLGNPQSATTRRRPWLYDADGYHFFPVLELGLAESEGPSVYGNHAKSLDFDEPGAPQYLCPAAISQELRLELIETTRRAAEALGVCDVARADFRMGSDGRPYLLEINTLPGLNPLISDLCIMAAAEGMTYHDLITEILYLAAGRNGMPFESQPRLGASVPAALGWIRNGSAVRRQLR
jgi:D-alanine-D-alanine ligase